MKGKLYNTSNNTVLLLVQETTKTTAIGYNMVNETFTQEKICNLEKTNPALIFMHLGSNKGLIGRVTDYFNKEEGISFDILSQYSNVKNRTLHRYIAEG